MLLILFLTVVQISNFRCHFFVSFPRKVMPIATEFWDFTTRMTWTALNIYSWLTIYPGKLHSMEPGKNHLNLKRKTRSSSRPSIFFGVPAVNFQGVMEPQVRTPYSSRHIHVYAIGMFIVCANTWFPCTYPISHQVAMSGLWGRTNPYRWKRSVLSWQIFRS